MKLKTDVYSVVMLNGEVCCRVRSDLITRTRKAIMESLRRGCSMGWCNGEAMHTALPGRGGGEFRDFPDPMINMSMTC